MAGVEECTGRVPKAIPWIHSAAQHTWLSISPQCRLQGCTGEGPNEGGTGGLATIPQCHGSHRAPENDPAIPYRASLSERFPLNSQGPCPDYRHHTQMPPAPISQVEGVKPSRTLRGSWAQNPFCVPHFSITGNRLQSPFTKSDITEHACTKPP